MNTPDLILYIIIAIVLLDYLSDRILGYLNARYRFKSLPEELRDIYDPERYRKAQDYELENHKFSVILSTFHLVLIVGFLISGGFAWIDEMARSLTGNPLFVPLIFFGLLFFAYDIINIPFQVYHTFVIEEKYGFNKTTPKLFVADKLKGWLLSAVLAGGILLVIVWFYQKTGDNFWIYTWIVIVLFTTFITMFYTHLILPLFNKLTPLADDELKSGIIKFSEKAGFTLKDIYVMDGSKRSTKANAFFSGLGKKKRIVLFDTLIDELKHHEIIAVLAHEIGHYKKKHTRMNLLLSIATTGLTLFILSLLIGNPDLSKALGAEQPSFHLGLITFSLLYSPVSTILGIGTNLLSRKHEYEADKFTVNHGLGNHLTESLKKLSSNNLSNLTPHPAYVFVNYSHPPLLSRIRSIKKNRKQQDHEN